MTTTQTPATPAAGVRRTHGAPYTTPGVTEATPAAVPTLRTAALDIAFGPRPEAAPCAECGVTQPPEPEPVFEFEHADEDGRLICNQCLPHVHAALALALPLLQFAAAARTPEARKAATDALGVLAAGAEMLAGEQAAPQTQQRNRPARRQPTRHNRRGRRR